MTCRGPQCHQDNEEALERKERRNKEYFFVWSCSYFCLFAFFVLVRFFFNFFFGGGAAGVREDMGGRESEHNWGVKLPKNQYKVKLKKKKNPGKSLQGNTAV